MNIWYTAFLSFLYLFVICIYINYINAIILVYLRIREKFAEDHPDIRIVHIVRRIGSAIVSLVSSATSLRDTPKMCSKSRDENTSDSKFLFSLSLAVMGSISYHHCQLVVTVSYNQIEYF